MAFYDWNKDGKKNWQDDYIEYNAYKNWRDSGKKKKSNNDILGLTESTYVPEKKTHSGSTAESIIAVVIVFTVFFAVAALVCGNSTDTSDLSGYSSSIGNSYNGSISDESDSASDQSVYDCTNDSSSSNTSTYDSANDSSSSNVSTYENANNSSVSNASTDRATNEDYSDAKDYSDAEDFYDDYYDDYDSYEDAEDYYNDAEDYYEEQEESEDE